MIAAPRHYEANTKNGNNTRHKNELTDSIANSCSKLYGLFSSTELTEVGNYHIIKLIGEGSFGKVYLAYHKLTHVKVVLKTGSKTDPNVVREVMFHKNFHYEHITKLFEIVVTENTVWMVLEYCPGNELYEHLIHMGRMPLGETTRLFAQICSAVYYSHSMRCVHRDLKLENILLDCNGNAKLTDFGFARDCSTKTLLETICGTTAYMAPELIENKPHYDGYKIDVWALGIMLYTMLAGFMPFDEVDDMKTRWLIVHTDPKFDITALDKNINNTKPSNDSAVHSEIFPPECKDLLTKLLNKDPYKRPKLKEILEHPFIRSYGIPLIEKVDKALSDQMSAKPFETKFQSKLLKRLQKTGFDVNGIKNSVRKQKCDSLYGLWHVLLYKEQEKLIKKCKQRRTPSRSRSMLSVRNFFSDQQDTADNRSLKSVLLPGHEGRQASGHKDTLSLYKLASKKSMDVLSLKKTNTTQSKPHNEVLQTVKSANTIESPKESIISPPLSPSAQSKTTSKKKSTIIQKFSNLSLIKKLVHPKMKNHQLTRDSRKRVRGDSWDATSRPSTASKKNTFNATHGVEQANRQKKLAYDYHGSEPNFNKKAKPSDNTSHAFENNASADLPTDPHITFTDNSSIKDSHLISYPMKQNISDSSNKDTSASLSSNVQLHGTSISRPGSAVSEISNTTFASTDYSTDGEQLSSRYPTPSFLVQPSPKNVAYGRPSPVLNTIAKPSDTHSLAPPGKLFLSPLNGAPTRRSLRRSYSNISTTSTTSDLSSRHDSYYDMSNTSSPIPSSHSAFETHPMATTLHSNDLSLNQSTIRQTTALFPAKTFMSSGKNGVDKIPWFLTKAKLSTEKRPRAMNSKKLFTNRNLSYNTTKDGTGLISAKPTAIDEAEEEFTSDEESKFFTNEVSELNGHSGQGQKTKFPAKGYTNSLVKMDRLSQLAHPTPKIQSPLLSLEKLEEVSSKESNSTSSSFPSHYDGWHKNGIVNNEAMINTPGPSVMVEKRQSRVNSLSSTA
ncbi:hypothetical protein ACO0QE_002394 [Hanseniaspora vineae]